MNYKNSVPLLWSVTGFYLVSGCTTGNPEKEQTDNPNILILIAEILARRWVAMAMNIPLLPTSTGWQKTG